MYISTGRRKTAGTRGRGGQRWVVQRGPGGQAGASAAGRAGPVVWQWQELAARAAYRAGADPGEGGKGDQPGHHLQDRRLQCLNGGDHYRRDRWQRVRSLQGSEEERGKIRRKRKKMKYCATQATIVTHPLLCLVKST